MYLPGFGSCSSLIHLAAKYPMGTLAIGILALTSFVISPVGPGVHSGAAGILQQQEAKMLQADPTLQARFDETAAAFKEVQNMPLANSSIQYVLGVCQQCKGITVEEIRRDPILMHDVAFLYFMNLVHERGVNDAKVIYLSQR
jgi:hypothetical protein